MWRVAVPVEEKHDAERTEVVKHAPFVEVLEGVRTGKARTATVATAAVGTYSKNEFSKKY